MASRAMGVQSCSHTPRVGASSSGRRTKIKVTAEVRGQNDGSDYDALQSTAEVVFSWVDGFVWASWPGTDASVKLGKCGPVTAMMQNFLDQCELGERLARKAAE